MFLGTGTLWKTNTLICNRCIFILVFTWLLSLFLATPEKEIRQQIWQRWENSSYESIWSQWCGCHWMWLFSPLFIYHFLIDCLKASSFTVLVWDQIFTIRFKSGLWQMTKLVLKPLLGCLCNLDRSIVLLKNNIWSFLFRKELFIYGMQAILQSSAQLQSIKWLFSVK